MRLAQLTTLLFSLVTIGSIDGENVSRNLQQKGEIRSNNVETNTILSAAKTKTPNHSTRNWNKPNEVDKFKVKETAKTSQKRFMSTKRLKFERNSLLKIHTKLEQTKTSRHKHRVLSKKQYIPNIFSSFPGGAWMQDPSISRITSSRQGKWL